MNDRATLLERCLRLEARLLGVVVDPPAAIPPEPFPVSPRVVVQMRGVTLRKTTPTDRAAMRELRANGRSCVAIARDLGFSESTVRVYTREAL